ncbi:MAG: hypothetical protein U0625_12490 [Phycisphaerales bacterium]
MQQLAAKHGAARAKFETLRDAAAKKLEAKPVAPLALMDWITLSTKVLRDEASVVTLIAPVRDDPAWKDAIQRNIDSIFDAFVAAGRWADAGALVADPEAALRHEVSQRDESIAHIDSTKAKTDGPVPGTSERMKRMMTTRFRDRVGRIYASLLAAGRDEAAAKFADQARAADPSPAMKQALLSAAQGAGQPRAQQQIR